MKLTEKTNSILELNNLYFNEISFSNNGNLDCDNNAPEITLSREISSLSESNHIVKLKFSAEVKDVYCLNVTVVGDFNLVSDNETMKEVLIKNNTISILFPYLRSEVTLLTSQPGMIPIVLPPINVTKLVEESEKEQKSE